MVRVGLISDTHGLLRPEAIGFLRGSDFIIHGSDIGNAGILDELRALAPVTAVRGNNEKGAWALSLPETEVLQIGQSFVYVLHDLAGLDIDPGAAGFRIVVSGHSHRSRIKERDGVLYVNPGSTGAAPFQAADYGGRADFLRRQGHRADRGPDRPGTHPDLRVTQRMFHADTEPDWVAVTVGQPFYRPVETGCQFNYAPSADEVDGALAPQCELIMGFDHPTERERLGFQKGVFEAVLVELETIPFVCIRFGQTLTVDGQWQHREAIGWQECPVHPIAAQGYVPPEPPPPQRWLLSAVLVDSKTQRVTGIRVVSLSTEFCQRFARAMNDHREDFASPAAYAAKLGHLYARYGVGELVAKGHMLAHCLGGD